MENSTFIKKQSAIHTVQTLALSEPAFSEGSIRWTIYRFRDALMEYGAIFHCGRKLLIDRELYISFLKNGAANE